MWGNRDWSKTFFTEGAKVADYLVQYSSVFNTVEGNTTFYGLPSSETVMRWAEEAADDFQFCFKFPQRITHALRLRDAGEETQRFFSTMEPIADKLGPFLLQLPPSFSPDMLVDLKAYLPSLPNDYRYTVEVRHLGFFHNHEVDDALCELLMQHGIDRVIFDTRPLFSAPPKTDAIREAQSKKPRVPANTYALGKHPSLRFVGHPDAQRSLEYFRPWLRKVATWIEEGKTPYVFIHTPHAADAPELAREFHRALREFIPDLPELADFPLHRQRRRENSLQNYNRRVVAAEVEENQLELF